MAGEILTLSDTNFETEIVASKSPALVDFYATWCGPCKTIAPIVEEIASEYAPQGLKVGKVDIDQAKDLAVQYHITGVPTLIFFKDGKVVDQLSGAYPRPVIEEKVKSLVS